MADETCRTCTNKGEILKRIADGTKTWVTCPTCHGKSRKRNGR